MNNFKYYERKCVKEFKGNWYIRVWICFEESQPLQAEKTLNNSSAQNWITFLLIRKFDVFVGISFPESFVFPPTHS